MTWAVSAPLVTPGALGEECSIDDILDAYYRPRRARDLGNGDLELFGTSGIRLMIEAGGNPGLPVPVITHAAPSPQPTEKAEPP